MGKTCSACMARLRQTCLLNDTYSSRRWPSVNTNMRRDIMEMYRSVSSRPAASRGADFRDVGVFGQLVGAREIPVLGAATLVMAAFELVWRGVVALQMAMGRALARKQMVARLSALDDRLLRDIGIGRDTIRAVSLAAVMRQSNDDHNQKDAA
jgi:uncharacterized protein YjiS (DUF1127 family)